MKKTLSLLLALVMVISLFPGFADEKATLTAEEAGAVLQGYGAIKGGSDGNLMIDKELKRQDAVVILTRLMGKEADALATQAAPSFEDITIDYYKPFLAFAEANKWVEGKAEKKFGFNDVVTVKEFTAMLLRALGHDTMGENYAKVMDLAKEQGLFQGVMAEEAAPVIRGVAFIMMNNTLETAPKGEKQALVYKLGYKEMPKPENLTVVSAEAAGLKAIDLKFSKEVNEESLVKIVIKENNKIIAADKRFLLDSMTGRIVLNKEAKQDTKFVVIIENVKSADMKEVVEKHEATVYMTDAVRPEVLSVEALNPKTLLVKTSEPVLNASSIVKKLDQFKIEGKALYGKILNENKNEIVVELNKALKPGDYKVEVSGIKDYAEFIAKTAEFDITVVEDKDAPVMEDAKMISVNAVKVVFNEGIYDKGAFRVNGKTAHVHKDFKKGDKEIVLELTEHLNIGAIVEVKVEYKGQKDIMNNIVKTWTSFNFKVEDDATLPEVKEVSVSGSTVKIEFTKNMLKKAPVASTINYNPTYTLMHNGKTIVNKQAIKAGDWNKEGNILYLTISNLSNANASEYTLVLDGLKDSTVRMNAMPKTEVAVTGKDTQKPVVTATYKLENQNSKEKYLVATLYFNEEMDEETLLDKKNFTFNAYKYDGVNKGVVRADAAAVNLNIDDNGKTLMIEASELEVDELGPITLVGLKDKAGNMLKGAPVTVTVHDTSDNQQYVKKVELIQGSEDEGYLVKIVVNDEIPQFKEGNGVVKLQDQDGNEVSALTLVRNDDNFTFYLKVDKQDKVLADAKSADAPTKTLKIVEDSKASEAKSILNDSFQIKKATNGTDLVVDRVAPGLHDPEFKIEKLHLAADNKTLNFDGFKDSKFFNEELTVLSGTITGNDLTASITHDGVNKNNFKIASINQGFESGKTYTINIINAVDGNGNTYSGTFEFTPMYAELVKMTPVFKADDANKLIGFDLEFSKEIKFTAGTVTNYTVAWTKPAAGSLDMTGSPTATLSADKKVISVRADASKFTALTSGTKYEDIKLTLTGAAITDAVYTTFALPTAYTISYTHN